MSTTFETLCLGSQQPSDWRCWNAVRPPTGTCMAHACWKFNLIYSHACIDGLGTRLITVYSYSATRWISYEPFVLPINKRLPWDTCGKVYTSGNKAQAGDLAERSWTWMHTQNVCLNVKSAIAEHAWTNDHPINCTETKIGMTASQPSRAGLEYFTLPIKFYFYILAHPIAWSPTCTWHQHRQFGKQHRHHSLAGWGGWSWAST